jgi:hypothetical protein
MLPAIDWSQPVEAGIRLPVRSGSCQSTSLLPFDHMNPARGNQHHDCLLYSGQTRIARLVAETAAGLLGGEQGKVLCPAAHKCF